MSVETQPLTPSLVIPDLLTYIPEMTPDSIISRTFYKDEQLKAILFAFALGQELSQHTSDYPAVLHFLQGTAEVTDANFDDANLARAAFSRAHAQRASFIDAVADWCKFDEANMSDSVLTRADLRNANLYRALLRGADARGAQLAGANVGGVQVRDAQVDPGAFRADQLEDRGR